MAGALLVTTSVAVVPRMVEDDEATDNAVLAWARPLPARDESMPEDKPRKLELVIVDDGSESAVLAQVTRRKAQRADILELMRAMTATQQPGYQGIEQHPEWHFILEGKSVV